MSQPVHLMEKKIVQLKQPVLELKHNIEKDLLKAYDDLSEISSSMNANMKSTLNEIAHDRFLMADRRYTVEQQFRRFDALARKIDDFVDSLPEFQRKETAIQHLMAFQKHFEDFNKKLDKLRKAQHQLDEALNAFQQEGPGLEAPYEAPFSVNETHRKMEETKSTMKAVSKSLMNSLEKMLNKANDYLKKISKKEQAELKSLFSDLKSFQKMFDSSTKISEKRKLSHLLSDRLQGDIYTKFEKKWNDTIYKNLIPDLYVIKRNIDSHIRLSDRLENLKSRLQFLDTDIQIRESSKYYHPKKIKAMKSAKSSVKEKHKDWEE